MAVTLAVVQRNVVGNRRRVIVDVTGPASYTTGGEALTAAQYAFLFPETSANASAAAFSNVVQFDSETNPTSTPAFLSCVLDKAGNKMLYTTAGAQTTAATNLSAQTVRCEFVY